MPELLVILPDGSERRIQAPEGTTVMTAVSDAGIPGIVAECGGSAMCATCHVYVDDAWVGRIRPALENELELLDCTAAERRSNSRLSCQIKLTADLHGLIVRLPERQQ